MKMRKSTWLLLVLALAAILLVAGCAPTTPGNGDEEPGNGEPPADKACPKVVKTEVSKLYVADPTDLTKPNFQIKITFDENINSSCIENLAKWAITVANTDRVGTPTVTKLDVDVDGKIVTVKARVVETGTAPAPTYKLVPLPEDWKGFGAEYITGTEILPGSLTRAEALAALEEAVEIANAVVDIVEGYSSAEFFAFLVEIGGPGVWEEFLVSLEVAEDILDDPDDFDLSEIQDALGPAECPVGPAECRPVPPETGLNEMFACLGYIAEKTGEDAPEFLGLICNQGDADRYKELLGKEVKSADEVSWKLTDCAVYDDLGNVCCDFSGKACCVEPYCEECPPPCDLTEPGACL